MVLALVLIPALSVYAEDVKKTDVYARIKAKLDAVQGIDTHSHLCGPGSVKHALENSFSGKTPKDCPLHYVWQRSYFTWGHHLARWPKDGNFENWWNAAQKNFQNSRARSAYRAMLPIFTDLYGVDFETLNAEQAKDLDAKMKKNYENPDWPEEVLVKKANTQFMVIDSYIHPRHTGDHFPWAVSICNVRWYINGFHEDEFIKHRNLGGCNPYAFAAKHKLPIKTLDDYVNVLDKIIVDAKERGAVGLKNQMAYDRTLQINWVPQKEAEKIFGKPREELNHGQIKMFQDYIVWKLAELSAKNDMPYQIHTGHARIPGSNPMNLVPLIQGNHKTKFILFHGGFPWIGESGMVALKYPNVYLDSVWMPTLSYSMGKQGYREWLEMISSDRIMWGSDMFTVEGSYGATIFARQCIYEALAEMVIDRELREEDAVRIGRQILRENALKVFSGLRKRLEKDATAK
jgi:hypothetical protein